jgi:hypothetical protein
MNQQIATKESEGKKGKQGDWTIVTCCYSQRTRNVQTTNHYIAQSRCQGLRIPLEEYQMKFTNESNESLKQNFQLDVGVQLEWRLLDLSTPHGPSRVQLLLLLLK